MYEKLKSISVQRKAAAVKARRVFHCFIVLFLSDVRRAQVYFSATKGGGSEGLRRFFRFLKILYNIQLTHQKLSAGLSFSVRCTKSLHRIYIFISLCIYIYIYTCM